MREKHGTKWTENETILAFYYYCRIPFGRIHKTNPIIIQLAKKIGRTPSSVALKMANFSHFDPTIDAKGMSNASKMDRIVVQKYMENWEELNWKAVTIAKKIDDSVEQIFCESQQFPFGGTKEQTIKERINQQFFRNAILTSYNQRCCITGIKVPELLIASHIKPWKESDPKTERTNPHNGLCLNALHDKAFDRGLITVLPDYSVRISSKLQKELKDSDYDWFTSFSGMKIKLPERFLPGKEFLEYHNDMVFIP